MDNKLKDRNLNVYANASFREALALVYEGMKAKGIPCDFAGKMNTSAVLQYALQQQIIRDRQDAPDRQPE